MRSYSAFCDILISFESYGFSITQENDKGVLYIIKVIIWLIMIIYLRNKFNFSEVHGSMTATSHVQSHVNFARDPLRSYFHEPQIKLIYFLYLHFVFTSFLFIIYGILI